MYLKERMQIWLSFLSTAIRRAALLKFYKEQNRIFKMKYFVEEFRPSYTGEPDIWAKFRPAEAFKVSSSLGTDWKPRPMLIPNCFLEVADKVHNMPVRSDDVCVFAFPKSGITWSLEMIWLIKNNFDFESAKQINLDKRYYYYEIDGVLKPLPQLRPCFVDKLESLKPPRLIKSHLPISFLPKDLWVKKPKIIYISRNVRDVIVSAYHYYKKLMNHSMPLETYVDEFIADNVVYTPYWAHVLDFWKMRNDKNVLFLTYEDMKNDLPKVIKKCCNFLNVTATEDNISKLNEHLKFENMRGNPAVNNDERISKLTSKPDENKFSFIRKGQVDGYKSELSIESIEKIEKWIRESLKDSDFDLYK